MKQTTSRSLTALLSLITLFAGSTAYADFIFLRPDSVDLRNFPPPPHADSSADIADMNGVRRFQNTRTRNECERATDESHITVESFFGPRRGVLTVDELAAVKELFLDISNDSEAFIGSLKRGYRRPRPFLRDSNIRLCVPKVGGFAYPSGHATHGRVGARALALVFPRLEGRLMARGDEVGLDRVIGGVHHPLDIEAGRFLGDAIFDALIKSPKFMHRIDEIRAMRWRYGRQR